MRTTGKSGFMKKNKDVGRPKAFETPQKLKDKCSKYFAFCEEQGKAKTMAGLICFLDICDDTFGNYLKGLYDASCDPQKDNFSETIKKARKFIENDKLDRALRGEYVPSVAIFDLKNNHGYADKVEQTTTHKGEAEVSLNFVDAEEAQRAYQKALRDE